MTDPLARSFDALLDTLREQAAWLRDHPFSEGEENRPGAYSFLISTLIARLEEEVLFDPDFPTFPATNGAAADRPVFSPTSKSTATGTSRSSPHRTGNRATGSRTRRPAPVHRIGCPIRSIPAPREGSRAGSTPDGPPRQNET
jgi:hypothetical protein